MLLPPIISNLMRSSATVMLVIATMALTIQARIFSCENSTLLYSVKSEDDQEPFIVFQDRNITRIFYQNPNTGLWDREADSVQHGKTCDFRVITQPIQQNCVTTTDGGSDRDLRMCSEEKVDPYADQTVAEHLVLIACSSDSSAFAKVANSEGSVHFLAAYHSMALLEQSFEWDAKNFSSTIKNFLRKQTCDDDNDHHGAASSANLPGTLSSFIAMAGAMMISLL